MKYKDSRSIVTHNGSFKCGDCVEGTHWNQGQPPQFDVFASMEARKVSPEIQPYRIRQGLTLNQASESTSRRIGSPALLVGIFSAGSTLSHDADREDPL